MTQKIKFAIAGCGMIADFHAKAINSLEGAELIGAVDNNPEKLTEFCEKYGIKAYGSFEEMISDEGTDAVCICTPSGLHADQAIKALQNGKHVVIEKPMALNTADADKIIDECQKNNCMLTVISQLRFNEDVRKIKALVEENAFGRLVLCDLYMKYWRDPEYYANGGWKGTFALDGGGALMNQGIHGIDLIQYIVGEARLLHGKTKTVFHDIEVEDSAVAAVEFDCGAMGVIEGTTCCYPGFERRIEILGSSGCAILNEGVIEKLIINGETLIENSKTDYEVNTASNPSAMSYQLHAMQIENFINAINGKEKLLIDAKEGRKAVRLIEEIYHCK